jgi:hypothetical protein
MTAPTDPNGARQQWVRDVLGFDIETGKAVASTSDPRAAALAASVAALEPEVTAAVRAAPEQRGTITASWAALQQYLAAGDTERAAATLERLRGLLAATRQMAASLTDAERHGIAPGTVAKQVAALEAMLAEQVEAARSQALREITEFTAGFDEVVEDPGAISDAIERYVDGLCAKLSAETKPAVQAGDAAALRKQVTAWSAGLAADATLAAIAEAADAFGLDDPREKLEQASERLLLRLAEHAA